MSDRIKFMKTTLARMERYHKHNLDYWQLADDEKKFMDFMLPRNDLRENALRRKSTI